MTLTLILQYQLIPVVVWYFCATLGILADRTILYKSCYATANDFCLWLALE